jgi:hypothetical protein
VSWRGNHLSGSRRKGVFANAGFTGGRKHRKKERLSIELGGPCASRRNRGVVGLSSPCALESWRASSAPSFKKTAPPPTRCALPTIPCLATYAAPTRPDTKWGTKWGTKRGTKRGHPEYPQRDVNASSFGCPSLQLGCSISAAWEARMQPSSRPFLRRAFRRRLRAAG